jgi:hypothetical protein
MDHAVSRQTVTVEDRVQSQARTCRTCDVQGGNATGSYGFPLTLQFHQCSKLTHSSISATTNILANGSVSNTFKGGN